MRKRLTATGWNTDAATNRLNEDTCRREEISLDLQIPGNIFRLTEAQLTIGTYHQIFIGGRLQFFTDEWQVISDDPWILDTIKSGLRIEFLE